MNASLRPFVISAALIATGAGVSGCFAFNPETDPTSPLAPRIQALVDANREYPRWEDFPKASEPVEVASIAASVGQLETSNAALAVAAARIDWQDDGNSDAFAQGVRDRVGSVPVSPETEQTRDDIDDFARRTRERGRAPPPVDRPN